MRAKWAKKKKNFLTFWAWKNIGPRPLGGRGAPPPLEPASGTYLARKLKHKTNMWRLRRADRKRVQ